MANPEQLVFGLDIGTRSVVGTVGYKKNINDFTVVAQAVKVHDTRAMMDGQIHDINRVAETIREVKQNLEKQLGKKYGRAWIWLATTQLTKTSTVNHLMDF